MSEDNPDYSYSPYDYPPEFTNEEEQAAREEGFFDGVNAFPSTTGRTWSAAK